MRRRQHNIACAAKTCAPPDHPRRRGCRVVTETTSVNVPAFSVDVVDPPAPVMRLRPGCLGDGPALALAGSRPFRQRRRGTRLLLPRAQASLPSLKDVEALMAVEPRGS